MLGAIDAAVKCVQATILCHKLIIVPPGSHDLLYIRVSLVLIGTIGTVQASDYNELSTVQMHTRLCAMRDRIVDYKDVTGTLGARRSRYCMDCRYCEYHMANR